MSSDIEIPVSSDVAPALSDVGELANEVKEEDILSSSEER
jgi:hypothetical protein